MRYFNTFKRGNHYVTQEWSAKESFDFDLWKWSIIIIIGALLSTIASILCLGIRLYDYDEDEKAPSFVGIIISTYLVIDYFNGWLLSFILFIVEDSYTVYQLVCLNIAIIVTHIFILVLGDTIYFNANLENRKPLLWFVTIMFSGILTLLLIVFLQRVIEIPVGIRNKN